MLVNALFPAINFQQHINDKNFLAYFLVSINGFKSFHSLIQAISYNWSFDNNNYD